MAQVTVRFFRIEKVHGSAPEFEVALKNVFASAEIASGREKEVHTQIFRLERLEKKNTFFDGEIVRKQTKDVPPEANDEGLQKLSVSEGGGIGHCIAFRYNHLLQVVAIQFDNRAVSVNRLCEYLRAHDPSYDYRAEALLREDAWEKYNRGLPTKLEFSLASPQNLAAVEGDVGAVLSSAKNLAELYDGPIITVEITMGRQKGSLTKSAVDGLLQHFTTGAGGDEDVRKLNATSRNEDGSEVINFLKEFLKESRDIEVPEGDPDGHYGKRRTWVETCFRMHFDYIQRVYGGSNVASS